MDVDRLNERIRQNRRMLRAQLTPTAPPASSPEERIGLPLSPGTRVFDTVTGQHGEVISGTRTSVVVPAPVRPTD